MGDAIIEDILCTVGDGDDDDGAGVLQSVLVTVRFDFRSLACFDQPSGHDDFNPCEDLALPNAFPRFNLQCLNTVASGVAVVDLLLILIDCPMKLGRLV